MILETVTVFSPLKIYVVIGHTVGYCDCEISWLVKAFNDKSAAEKLAKQAQDRADVIAKKLNSGPYTKHFSDSKMRNKYDPEMDIIGPGAYYIVREVMLEL